MVMEKAQNDDSAYLFWVLFQQAHLAMSKVREKELKSLGITPNQATLISIVKELGKDCTPTEISKRLIRESHTVTELINRVVKMGFVRKEKNSIRKNGVMVVLTPMGENVYEQITKLPVLRRLISVLPPKQRKYVESFSRVLRDNALNELVDIKNWWIPPKFTDPSYDTY
jgi:DNA-binding MarR family transcriptional regulator